MIPKSFDLEGCLSSFDFEGRESPATGGMW
jgi:hypothetical protein